MKQYLSRHFFNYIHSNFLIYNICWEDPRIDRELLNISSNDHMLMITSAGCNALNYLLDQPRKITCVDVNPKQSALLELKIAVLKSTDWDTFYQLFSNGYHRNFKVLYFDLLREYLSVEAREIWDQDYRIFLSGNGLEKAGTSGFFADIMHRYLSLKPNLYQKIMSLAEADTLEEQRSIFTEIDKQLWTPFSKWLMNQNSIHALLGVPVMQKNMIKREYKGDVSEFIRECFHHIFHNLPVQDNYFWRYYITGSFSENCAPEYLKQENFELLKKAVDAINIKTTTISQVLKADCDFSVCVLLDHQDWMYDYAKSELEEEWELLLRLPENTRYLLRSAGKNRSFLPKKALNELSWKDEPTSTLHKKDRVGTYGSTHFGVKT